MLIQLLTEPGGKKFLLPTDKDCTYRDLYPQVHAPSIPLFGSSHWPSDRGKVGTFLGFERVRSIAARWPVALDLAAWV